MQKENTMKKVLIAAFAIATLTACGDKNKEAAETLLQQATTQYESKQYDRALLTIDSLRRTYPEAIEVRKAALKLYQDVALKQAQDDLANTDSLLQRVKTEYDQMSKNVAAAKAALKATPNMLQSLTLKRMERDSLQVRFDVQCAKIKYIHKKQKE